MRIRRTFITLGDRQVHARHAGTGDPVILIHQSPTSGRTLDAQTEAFGRAGFAAIAIDIPGLGRSDPLRLAQPEIEDQAFALRELLDAIGLQRVAFYGSHTGALICAEFAARWPERASVILVDGYPIYTPGERERRVANYFPPFEMRWDGGHLLWLWYRYREQYLFWPWNVPGESTQARCDVPDPVFLHEGVVDMLRAGNAYRTPYAAAFRCKSDDLLRRLRVPTYFLAYPDDSLTPAIALMQGLPACCKVEPMPAERAAGIAKEIELLRRHAPGAGSPALATTTRTAGVTRSYVAVDEGQLAVRTSRGAAGKPLVIIPPTPGSASMLLDEIDAFGRTRSTLALDAPGSGDSDALASTTVDAMADALAQAVERLGLDRFDLFAMHGGCAPALALAARLPQRIEGIVCESPALGYPTDAGFIDRYAPPIVPQWDGTHLISLWHATRNRRLFRPWFDQRLAARCGHIAAIDVDIVSREVQAYLESWRTYDAAWRSVLSYQLLDLALRLERARGSLVRWASQVQGEFAVQHIGDREVTALPAPVGPRVEAVLALLESGKT